jgi:hypothetical protein
MNLTTYTDFEQGSELWHRVRMGMVTTSRLKHVMAKGVGREESKTRANYLHELGAELYWGKPAGMDAYKSADMLRGNIWEPDALLAYKLKRECDVDKVAFIRNDELMCGVSPDGLVGNDGGVEIKTMRASLMFEFLRSPGIPPQHIHQLHGAMMVTGRKWWDIAIYTEGAAVWVERVMRDDNYIDQIKRFLVPFQDELAKAILDITGETIQTWRKRLDDRNAELFMEANEGGTDAKLELGQAVVGEQRMSGGVEGRPIAALLRASLEEGS